MSTAKFSGYSQVAAGVFALGIWMIVSPLLFGAPPAESVTPVPYPADRYAKLAAHSPFTPPTAPAIVAATPTPPPPPSFTEKLTATAIMQWGSVYRVTIADPDNPRHIDLFSDKVDPDTQMQIESVKWPQPTNGTILGAPNEPPIITLRKGQERGTVRYEPGNSSGPIGGVMGAPTGASRSPVSPFANNPVRPQIPPTIPGSGGSVPAMPGQTPINGVQRRAPIRSVPQPPPATGARPIVRPGVNAALPGRPVNGKDDDDDDDD